MDLDWGIIWEVDFQGCGSRITAACDPIESVPWFGKFAIAP